MPTIVMAIVCLIMGIVNAFLVINLWTHKYLQGKPDESIHKYFIFTITSSIILNGIVIKLVSPVISL